ncbi:MAG: hypothetical protein M1820_001774 [Bogoriella megaspora]|nr:MAG: hypothetical protein M1820_001774 [Bogoriella megaspora]
MDPFSVIGLTSSIAQFLDFSINLISKSHKLYTSSAGLLQDNVDLVKVSQDLQELSRTLGLSLSDATCQSDRMASLQKMALSCEDAATELIQAVEKLQLSDGPGRRWRTFRKALKSLWDKQKIAELEKRLDWFRKELTIDVVVDVRNHQLQIFQGLQQVLVAADRLGNEQASSLKHLIAELQSQRRLVEDLVTRSPQSLSDISQLQANPPESSLACCDDITSDDEDTATSYHVFGNYLSKLIAASARSVEMQKSHKVLRSLYFTKLGARHADVPEAHENTFEWVFEVNKCKDPGLGVKLVEWMQFEDGIFWISGKPGSGKSTFMKFLYNHEKTRQALQAWAGSSKLVTAAHFFWSTGNENQKSQKGLLRSLLFEILRQAPELIPAVCSWQWEAVKPSSHEDPYTEGHLWDSLQPLAAAFRKLRDLSNPKLKFCIFVDGMDENQGDHQDIIDILSALTQNPAFKVCASSRPLNIFENTFGKVSGRKLYMHLVTEDDIRLYAKAKLEACAASASVDDPSQATLLVDQIVAKSQGVFLWVFLVVRSLREGIINGDDFEMLDTRLQTFPPDLEPFFKQIIQSVDPIYSHSMAKSFLCALEATEPLELLLYYHIQQKPQNAITMRIESCDATWSRRECHRMRRQINAISRGLLEVSDSLHLTGLEERTPEVNFLHRTVRDFLWTNEMQSILKDSVEPSFKASPALCRACLALMKSAPESVHDDYSVLFQFSQHGNRSANSFARWLDHLLYYANLHELKTGTADTELMDNVQRTLETLALRRPNRGVARNCPIIARHTFVELVTVHGLKNYALERMKMEDRTSRVSVLTVAVYPAWIFDEGTADQIDDLITYLIKSGRDGAIRIWKAFFPLLLDLYARAPNGRFKDRDNIVSLCDRILERGCDPNAEIHGQTLVEICAKALVSTPLRPAALAKRAAFATLRKLMHNGALLDGKSYVDFQTESMTGAKEPDWLEYVLERADSNMNMIKPVEVLL